MFGIVLAGGELGGEGTDTADPGYTLAKYWQSHCL